MNKKALFLLGALVLGATVGCDKEDNNSTNANNSTNNPAPAAEKYSVGLGYHASWSDDDQQLDFTTAFAAFDKDGKVYDVRFDVVQVIVKANEAKTGVELNVAEEKMDNGSVKSKLELGSLYGMYNHPYGSKLAEVNAQIESFADYCVGKTVAEVVASTTGAGHGTAVAPELEGKVTITVDAFETALTYAYENKSTATYELSGTAGVAMNSGLAYNYGDPETDISIEFAGAIAKDGKVEVALLDTAVFPLATNAETGAVTPNAKSYYFAGGNDTTDGDTTKLRSKKDLGDEYGMKGFQGCTKEWYEQAAIMENACVGKTSAEIATFVKNEGGFAGVTITTGNYVKALSKAADYAGRTVINAN